MRFGRLHFATFAQHRSELSGRATRWWLISGKDGRRVVIEWAMRVAPCGRAAGTDGPSARHSGLRTGGVGGRWKHGVPRTSVRLYLTTPFGGVEIVLLVSCALAQLLSMESRKGSRGVKR